MKNGQSQNQDLKKRVWDYTKNCSRQINALGIAVNTEGHPVFYLFGAETLQEHCRKDRNPKSKQKDLNKLTIYLNNSLPN